MGGRGAAGMNRMPSWAAGRRVGCPPPALCRAGDLHRSLIRCIPSRTPYSAPRWRQAEANDGRSEATDGGCLAREGGMV